MFKIKNSEETVLNYINSVCKILYEDRIVEGCIQIDYNGIVKKVELYPYINMETINGIINKRLIHSHWFMFGYLYPIKIYIFTMEETIIWKLSHNI
jgi:hypothetical protein